MKTVLLIFICVLSSHVYAQQTAPITDTITVNSWQEAVNKTFGLLPNTHYPSSYLFNKANPIPKIEYANGELNDSIFNTLEFYYIQNAIRLSYTTPDSIKGYLVLDSLKDEYIRLNNILPWGIVDITGHYIKDSAFINNAITVANYRLVENTNNISSIYGTKKMCCVAPLNMEVYTLNPQFIIKPEFIFTNTPIATIEVDLDDDLGFKPITLGIPFQAAYTYGGYKVFTTRIIHTNGDTSYSRSELNIINNNIQNKLAQTYEPYEDVFEITESTPYLGDYPAEFSVPYDKMEYNTIYDRRAEIGIWYGCNNINKKLRKPFVIFAGYNPKDGKSLAANGRYDWVNNSFGAVCALDGWRGPLYETYNGFYTNASKNSAYTTGDNNNRFLDKLRQEGYDICIVRFHDGIGLLQNNAFLTSLVLKYINKKIIDETDKVLNPGADLDPEASGYPNTTVLKKAKHELVVAGYSAGALGGRMGLLLMEFEHEKYKHVCNPNDYNALIKKIHSTPHRTRIWIGVDHEAQGSNTPIGQQMLMDFERSIWFLPANIADILNTLICKGALALLGHNGVATQNTLYHLGNMRSNGSGNWDVGHHPDFDTYFNDLTAITPANYPDNLKGYPIQTYRISVSQGSANGVKQLLNSKPMLMYNESPSTFCVNPLGTLFGVGNKFLKATAYREATAKVLTSTNSEAFTCKLGVSFRTVFVSWHVNFGHWKYYKSNTITDQYFGRVQNYDEVAGSTLPSHILLATKTLLSSPNPITAGFGFCNQFDWNGNHHGFSPTVSGLDMHLPGNNALPRLPNLSLVPGNVSGGLNMMMQNKYNLGANSSPEGNFGYPHLTFPSANYDHTPYDAVWANTINANSSVLYNDNTIHVEDPNPEIGKFLTEEIAPPTLYLSNRTIQGERYTCTNNEKPQVHIEKYYADFEARNSVMIGDQSIYEHNAITYKRVRTPEGDFVIGNDAVVNIRANNGDGLSTVTLGAGFSAKHGSIVRAYVYGDSYCAAALTNQRNAQPANNVSTTEPRPILTKRTNALKLTNSLAPINIVLYPNPTNGSLTYIINENEAYNYTLTDLAGRLLQTGTLKQNINTVDMYNLQKGIYIITVYNKHYTQTDKIILN